MGRQVHAEGGRLARIGECNNGPRKRPLRSSTHPIEAGRANSPRKGTGPQAHTHSTTPFVKSVVQTTVTENRRVRSSRIPPLQTRIACSRIRRANERTTEGPTSNDDPPKKGGFVTSAAPGTSPRGPSNQRPSASRVNLSVSNQFIVTIGSIGHGLGRARSKSTPDALGGFAARRCGNLDPGSHA